MIVYKEGSQLIFKKDEEDFLIYEFKDDSFINKKGKKIKSPQTFFRNTKPRDIINSTKDEKYALFLKKVVEAEDMCRNMGTFLERLKKYKNLEGWILLNVEVDKNVSIKTTDIPKDILKIIKENNIKIDKHVQFVLKQSDFLKHIKYLHEDYGKHYIEIYIDLLYSKDKNIIRLVNEQRYEYKSLIDYIFRISENEGIPLSETVRFLDDYANMQSVMKNNKYEKYPKFLHSVHDIVTKNYNLNKTVYDEEAFRRKVDISLEYINKNFKVIVPKKTEDIREEGVRLSHCVASYVSKIIRGACQLAFLREKEDESLITVEIRRGFVVQAKGFMNRELNQTEKKWLSIYCKEKNLKIR